MSSRNRINRGRQSNEDGNAPPESSREIDDKSQFSEHGRNPVPVSTPRETDHRMNVDSGGYEVKKFDFMQQSKIVASWLDDAFQLARNDPACKFYDSTLEPRNTIPTSSSEQSRQLTSLERPSSIFGVPCKYQQQSDAWKENNLMAGIPQSTPIMHHHKEDEYAGTNIQVTNSFCKSPRSYDHPTEEDRQQFQEYEQHDFNSDAKWDDPSIEVELPHFDLISELPNNRKQSTEPNDCYPYPKCSEQEDLSSVDYVPEWDLHHKQGVTSSELKNVGAGWELEYSQPVIHTDRQTVDSPSELTHTYDKHTYSKKQRDFGSASNLQQEHDQRTDRNKQTSSTDSDTEFKHRYKQRTYSRQPKNVVTSWGSNLENNQPVDADRQTDNSASGTAYANEQHIYSKKENDLESGSNFQLEYDQSVKRDKQILQPGLLHGKRQQRNVVGLSIPSIFTVFDVPCKIDQLTSFGLPNASGKRRYNNAPELPYGYDQKAFERDEADFLAATKMEYEQDHYMNKDKQASDYISTYTSGQDQQYGDFVTQTGEIFDYQHEFEQASRMQYNYPPPPLGEVFDESVSGLEHGYDYQDNSALQPDLLPSRFTQPGYESHNRCNHRGDNNRYLGMNTRQREFASASETRYNPNTAKQDQYGVPKGQYGSHYSKPHYQYDKNFNQHSQYECNREESDGTQDRNMDSGSQESAHSAAVDDTFEMTSDQQRVPSVSNENNSTIRRTSSKRKGSKGKQKEENRPTENLKKETSQAKSNVPNIPLSIADFLLNDLAHLSEAAEIHRNRYQPKTKKAETKKPDFGNRK